MKNVLENMNASSSDDKTDSGFWDTINSILDSLKGFFRIDLI